MASPECDTPLADNGYSIAMYVAYLVHKLGFTWLCTDLINLQQFVLCHDKTEQEQDKRAADKKLPHPPVQVCIYTC
jgi:hypothetical protein